MTLLWNCTILDPAVASKVLPVSLQCHADIVHTGDALCWRKTSVHSKQYLFMHVSKFQCGFHACGLKAFGGVSLENCLMYQKNHARLINWHIVIHIPRTALVFVFFNVSEGSLNNALINCKPGKKKRLSTRGESEGQIVNVTFEGQQAI